MSEEKTLVKRKTTKKRTTRKTTGKRRKQPTAPTTTEPKETTGTEPQVESKEVTPEKTEPQVESKEVTPERDTLKAEPQAPKKETAPALSSHPYYKGIKKLLTKPARLNGDDLEDLTNRATQAYIDNKLVALIGQYKQKHADEAVITDFAVSSKNIRKVNQQINKNKAKRVVVYLHQYLLAIGIKND